ncbi:MAG: hypothetical protein ACOC31_01555 [Bacteroidota bacterium]
MKSATPYENYPLKIVLIANLSSLLIYTVGFYVLFKVHWIWALAYLAYVFFLEFRLLGTGCINCYYYNKRCAFGKGKISALFFKKANNQLFCEKSLTWKDMIPDLLVSLIPFLAGIVLLIWNFSLILFVLLAILVLLSTIGNGFIRGKLACKNCIQRDLGCPADQLFNK